MKWNVCVGVGEYLCGHNVLLSHAAAYHVYKEKYFAKFNGKIGITLNSRFFYPKNENVTDDVIERALQYRVSIHIIICTNIVNNNNKKINQIISLI